MQRLALLTLLALLVVPAASHGAGCSPLDCAPSQAAVGRGNLLAVRARGIDGPVRVIDLRSGATRWRLPAGILAGDILTHVDGSLITWFDASTGQRVGDALRSAKGTFELVGTSQDGRRAVLARTQTRSTTFAIVSTSGQRTVRVGGNSWAFDAVRGNDLYLLHVRRVGYDVRRFDLAHNRLDPRALKDPNEPAVLSGAPWQRLASADGRYLFTLTIDSSGKAMVHELDLQRRAARCVDLPGRGNFDAATSYVLVLGADGRMLWAVSPEYGRVVAIDIAPAKVRLQFTRSFAWTAVPGSPVSSTAVLSPDGERIAVALAGNLWFVQLAQRRIVRAKPQVAIAIGFSPDQKRLWAVGERSRVVALPVP